MKPAIAIMCAALTAVFCDGPVGFAASMDFDSVPIGTLFGSSAGHEPGDVVLSQEGIDMSVEDFVFEGSTEFFDAEVGGRYSGYFPTTPLLLDNIGVRFDFVAVGFEVNLVTLEFMEFGGANNFAVNDGAIYELTTLYGIPAQVAADVIALADNGIITLEGDVNSVRIGGQELTIDTVVAVPEPITVVLLCLGAAPVLRYRARRKW